MSPLFLRSRTLPSGGPLLGTHVASKEGMRRHAYGIWGLFFLTLFACGISVMLGSLYGALISLGVGIVITFVMSIAWTRFRGGPKEHHPGIDRLFKDMRR